MAARTNRFVGIRLPVDLIARIEQWAAPDYLTRSEAIRRLVELGLDAKPARKPRMAD